LISVFLFTINKYFYQNILDENFLSIIRRFKWFDKFFVEEHGGGKGVFMQKHKTHSYSNVSINFFWAMGLIAFMMLVFGLLMKLGF